MDYGMGRILCRMTKTITLDGYVHTLCPLVVCGMWIKFVVIRMKARQAFRVSYPPRFVTVQCKYEQIEICDDFKTNQMTVFERLYQPDDTK